MKCHINQIPILSFKLLSEDRDELVDLAVVVNNGWLLLADSKFHPFYFDCLLLELAMDIVSAFAEVTRP